MNRKAGSSDNDSGTESDLRTKRRKIAETTPFCSACRQFNFGEIESRANAAYTESRQSLESLPKRMPRMRRDMDGKKHVFYNDGFLVHRFRDRLSAPSDCPLCQFFRGMRVEPDRHQNYKLMAFCSSDSAFCCLSRLRISGNCETIFDSMYLSVIPDYLSIPMSAHVDGWVEEGIPAVGAIFPEHTEQDASNWLVRPRRLGQMIEFDVLREWFKFCETHHDSDCRSHNPDNLISKAFHVIDCFKDPPVVEQHRWGIPYVALSYVWGTSDEDKEEWPTTVLDAVSVTKEMGLRYLWVDRLCIDQKSVTEKQYLISKMAVIYEYAEFVIVAAAGFGASRGLPGVRSTPRQAQPSVQLEDGTMLLSTCPDPRLEILQSRYWTRGWTYQEAILARRRLVFTEHQAYWECRCMAIHESIVVPLELVHEEGGERMADFMRSGIFRGPEYSGGATRDTGESLISSDGGRIVHFGFRVAQEDVIRSRLRGLNEHVREFSARQLGNQEDSLSAFLGIADWYSSTHQLHLFLGIPAWIGTMPRNRPGAQITFAFSVSAWHHRRENDHHVFVAEACNRRKHLPSWTWAGWEGKVTWRSPPMNEHAAIMCEMTREEIDLIWAADVYLLQESRAVTPIHLRDVSSISELAGHERVKLLVINEPLILSHYSLDMPDRNNRNETFQWQGLAGRAGEDQIYTGRLAFDLERRRLARRMVAIGLSVAMTMEEWTEKHSSGELVSVLTWAGRTPCTGDGIHGSARFLTVRQVPSSTPTPRWERVGVLQLTLPGFKNCELGKSRTEEDMLSNLPLKDGGRVIVIQ